jgi:hypothetical protein
MTMWQTYGLRIYFMAPARRRSAMDALLPQADYVVLTVPLAISCKVIFCQPLYFVWTIPNQKERAVRK